MERKETRQLKSYETPLHPVEVIIPNRLYTLSQLFEMLPQQETWEIIESGKVVYHDWEDGYLPYVISFSPELINRQDLAESLVRVTDIKAAH